MLWFEIILVLPHCVGSQQDHNCKQLALCKQGGATNTVGESLMSPLMANEWGHVRGHSVQHMIISVAKWRGERGFRQGDSGS